MVANLSGEAAPPQRYQTGVISTLTRHQHDFSKGYLTYNRGQHQRGLSRNSFQQCDFLLVCFFKLFFSVSSNLCHVQ